MQSKRTRATDSRGRAVPGLYERDGKFSAGYRDPNGRWRMTNLSAATLTEARRERASLIAGLREGARRAAPAATTVEDLFSDYQDSRANTISERTRKHERHLFERHLCPARRAPRPRRERLRVGGAVSRSSPPSTTRPGRRWPFTGSPRARLPSEYVAVSHPLARRRPRTLGDPEAAQQAPDRCPRRRGPSPTWSARPRQSAGARRSPWQASLACASERFGRSDGPDVDLDAGALNAFQRSLLPDGTAQGAQDEGGHPHRPDHSGPAAPTGRVASALAPHPAHRSRRLHRERRTRSGAEPTPRPRRRQDHGGPR